MSTSTPPDWRALNRTYWDERVPLHVASDYYDLERFRAGADALRDRSVEWQHPIGAVVSALAAAGLRLDFLHEHEASLYQRFESFERSGDGYYRFPDTHARIPLMYSLRASKP